MSEWISVKDRLPNYGDDCLIYINKEIHFAHYWQDDFYQPYTSYNSRYIKKNITHYMPLPKPPEDTND